MSESQSVTASSPAVPIRPKRRRPDVPTAQLSLADEVAAFEVNTLPDEVRRYLAAVDTFRLEGCPPSYRPEFEGTSYA